MLLALTGVHMLHKMFTKDGAKSIHWGCCNNSCPPPRQCCHILPFVFNWAAVQNYIFLLPRSFHPQKMSQLLISLLGIFPINFFLDRVQYNNIFVGYLNFYVSYIQLPFPIEFELDFVISKGLGWGFISAINLSKQLSLYLYFGVSPCFPDALQLQIDTFNDCI